VRPAALAVYLLVAALVTSSAASAHVVPVPQFLATGSVTTMSFAVPNERREPMSGVTVSVPAGVHIVRAHPTAGWTATLDGSNATWRGGPLAHLTVETFRLDVDVSASPGPVTLNTRELYPSGATVDWPATLTVVPGPNDEQSESVGWGWIAAIAGVGLIFVVGLVVLARRREPRANPTGEEDT
jgi:uncharacterized protein DUF1775